MGRKGVARKNPQPHGTFSSSSSDLSPPTSPPRQPSSPPTSSQIPVERSPPTTRSRRSATHPSPVTSVPRSATPRPKRQATAEPSKKPLSPPSSPSTATSSPNSSTSTPSDETATAPPRSARGRLNKQKRSIPPSGTHTRLQFTDPTHQARYHALLRQPIVPCKYIDSDTLHTLGLHQTFLDMFSAIGWLNYMEIDCPAYIELVQEFFATFTFEKPTIFDTHTPHLIKFQLMGQTFSMSIYDFNCAFNFAGPYTFAHHSPNPPLRDYPDDFVAIDAFRELTGDPTVIFDPSRAKANLILSPTLRYIHRFLAYSFSGRKDNPSILSKAELFFLWCMVHGRRVDLGFWFVTQINSVISFRRPLILGSYITQLAANLNLIDLKNMKQFPSLHLACVMQPLDIRCLNSMGLIRQQEDGSFSFVPTGPILPRNKRATATQDTATATPSTSATPFPASSHSLEERLDRLETTIQTINAQVSQHGHILQVLSQHFGIRPPTPPS